MLVDLSLFQAVKEIGATKPSWTATIVPAQTVAPSHAPYRPEYAWLFHWEREVARALEPWTRELRHELVGAGGIVSEALANAYCHGHRRDANLPIEVALWTGERGVLLRIKDQGRGFCARSTSERLRAGRRYFEHAGNGMRSMERSEAFEVFYDDGGSAFHLLRRLAVEGRELTGS